MMISRAADSFSHYGNCIVIRKICVAYFLTVACVSWTQTGCPAYSSIPIDNMGIDTIDDGMARNNGTQVTVNLYSAPSGTSCSDDNCTAYQFDADDAKTAANAVNSVNQIPNTNISLKSVNLLQDNGSYPIGTVSNPIINIVPRGSRKFDNACSDVAEACVRANLQTYNGTDSPSIGAMIYLLEPYGGIGSDFTKVAEHEIVAHAILGLSDCKGANCSPSSSVTYNNGDDANPNSTAAISNCDKGYLQSHGKCSTDNDCTGGFTCRAGTCGCTTSCDDSACTGYSCEACGTNCGSGCSNSDQCDGGTVCMSGTCGCSDPCDDTSCEGYSAAACGGSGGGGGGGGGTNCDSNDTGSSDNGCEEEDKDL